MAVQGTYSQAFSASIADLAQRLKAVAADAGVPGDDGQLPTADQQAERMALAIGSWLATVPVVVLVRAAGDPLSLIGDPGLQTAASPGSPTLVPAATMELLGYPQVSGLED